MVVKRDPIESYYDPQLPLSRASTMPSRCYTSREAYDLEMERIFSKAWIFVGRKDKVSKTGDFFTCTVADEPILVVRTEDGGLRSFYNVCRHRANIIVPGGGNTKDFECCYHRATYSLGGELMGMPHWAGVEEFDRAQYGLIPVKVDSWENFVFVNLDPESEPLAFYLEDIPKRAKPWRLSELKWTKRVEYEIACNWKVFWDNFMEVYHLPSIHLELNEITPYLSYNVSEEGAYGPLGFESNTGKDPTAPVSISRLGLEGGHQRPFIEGLGEQERTRVYWVQLFPNSMVILSPDYVSTFMLVPAGPHRTLLYNDFYFPHPERADFDASDAYEVLDRVNKEDNAICERVQRGLQSRSYDTGRLSVEMEGGVYAFQSVVRDWIAGQRGQPR